MRKRFSKDGTEPGRVIRKVQVSTWETWCEWESREWPSPRNGNLSSAQHSIEFPKRRPLSLTSTAFTDSTPKETPSAFSKRVFILQSCQSFTNPISTARFFPRLRSVIVQFNRQILTPMHPNDASTLTMKPKPVFRNGK